MDALLNEVKLLPGVMGSFIYHSSKGVLATNLPSLFRVEALKQVGSLMGRVYKLVETTGIDVSSFEISYEEAILMVRQVDKNSCFVIVCEPSVSFPLVNMSTSMLIPELKVAIASAPAEQLVPTSVKREAPAAAAAAVDVDPDKLMASGPLSAPLKGMKVALAHAIGPIANLVMSESIENWCQSGAATQARLKDLAKILAEEINDAQLEEKFYGEISSII